MSNKKSSSLVPTLRFPEFREEWEVMAANKVFAQISNTNHHSDLPILAITQEHGAIPRQDIDYHVCVTEKSIESYKVVEQGDFIISLRSFQGGIEYSNYKGLCSPAYVILRKIIDVENVFFRHFFKTKHFIQQMNKNIEGIRDGKIVTYKQFSQLLLFLPSLEEQQKIAACLSSSDELITAHSQKLDALKKHKKGLMQQLFPAEGETVPTLRFPEFREAGEWEEKSLEEMICKMQSGLSRLLSNSDIGLPVIRSNNIQDGNLDILDIKYWYLDDPQGAKTSDYYLEDGDLLVNFINSIAQIGKSTIYKNLLKRNVIFTTNLLRLKIKKEVNNEFIYFFFQTNTYQDYIQSITKPAINQASFTTKEFCKLIVKTPSITEQQKIAACLSSLDELITAQGQKLDALKKHKKGLMQQLFPAVEEE